MTDQPEAKAARFRGLRRLLKAVLILIVAAAGVALIALAVVWGHFWSFQVGSPSSATCSSCHIHADAVASLSDSTLLASSHANQDVTCTDCHARTLDDQVRETVAWLTNRPTAPLPRLNLKMDTCFACHEHGSYDQIAWRTTDLGVTDGTAKGHIANPHQPPHYTALECNNCHRMHEPSTLLCSECHTYQFPGLPVLVEATPAPVVP